MYGCYLLIMESNVVCLCYKGWLDAYCIIVTVVVFLYILNGCLLLVDHRIECCVFMLCKMVRCIVHNSDCCGFSVYFECVVFTC